MKSALVSPGSQRGFTFIELSFVIIVFGMVAAVIAQVVPAMRRSSSTAETVRNIVSVQFSLESFAATHSRLPCADTDGDGVENLAPSCQTIGTVPHVTLGYPGPLVNADNYPFKYAIYQRDSADLRLKASLGSAVERYRPSTGTPVSATDLTVQLTNKSYGSTNRRLDFCQGLRAGMDLPYDQSYLHVVESGKRTHVAYVLVDPGIGNMDLAGDLFDGLNGTASAALPEFEHPSRSQSMTYDDRVVVTYFDEMWDALGCSATMATAGRASPDLETTLALFKQSAADYHDQLDIAVDMGFADNFAAAAAVLSAAAGVVKAAGVLLVGIGSAMETFGATSGSAVAAGVGVGLSAVTVGLAAVNLGLTVDNYEKLKDRRADFETLVSTRLNPLYESVKADVARSGDLVYSDK
jgi:prepilin-type N-terminal cleavage/methylation domain-containing protein